MRHTIAFVLLILVMISYANATSYAIGVSTNSSGWYIYRQTMNISFSSDQSVIGTAEPVNIHGRVISPFISCQSDVKINDVTAKQRTSAQQGNYSSEEILRLKALAIDPISVTILKPAGSNLYTVSLYENWPVGMGFRRSINYSGAGINDQELAGNNHDFVENKFLYNTAFSRESRAIMNLERMNSTIMATDLAMQEGYFMATRDTNYSMMTHSTGIADLSYRQSGAKIIPGKSARYEVANANQERYYGTYDIARNIRMTSIFNDVLIKEEWLPCCAQGWFDVNEMDQNGHGTSAKGIFDCSCSTTQSMAQFPEH